MDSHPVIEQLLMICPQHSRNTVETTLNIYLGGNFSDAELLQVCLDDLVDLPDLNGLNVRPPESDDLQFGGTGNQKDREEDIIMFEVNEPKFATNAAVSTPLRPVNQLGAKSDLKNSAVSPSRSRDSPLLKTRGSLSSPSHKATLIQRTPGGMLSGQQNTNSNAIPSPSRRTLQNQSASASYYSPSKEKVKSNVMSSPVLKAAGSSLPSRENTKLDAMSGLTKSPRKRVLSDPTKTTVEDVESIIQEANDIYNMFSRPKSEGIGGKRKLDTMLAGSSSSAVREENNDASLLAGPKNTTLKASVGNLGQSNRNICNKCGKEQKTFSSVWKSSTETCHCGDKGSTSEPRSVNNDGLPTLLRKSQPASSATSTKPAVDFAPVTSKLQELSTEVSELRKNVEKLQSSTGSRESLTTAKNTTIAPRTFAATVLNRPGAQTTSSASASRTSTTPAKLTTVRSAGPGIPMTPANPSTTNDRPGTSAVAGRPRTATNTVPPPRQGTSTTHANAATTNNRHAPALHSTNKQCDCIMCGTPWRAGSSVPPGHTSTAAPTRTGASTATPARAPSATPARPGAAQEPARHPAEPRANPIATATPLRPGAQEVARPVAKPRANAIATAAPNRPGAAHGPPRPAEPRANPIATALPKPGPSVTPARPNATGAQNRPAAAVATDAAANPTAATSDDDMISQLFPDVDPNHVDSLRKRFANHAQANPGMLINLMCDDLLENGYPKRNAANANADPEPRATPVEQQIDFYSDQSSTGGYYSDQSSTGGSYAGVYNRQAKKLLEKDFSKMRAGHLEDFFADSGYRYAKTRKNILDMLEKAGVQYEEVCHQNLFPRRDIGYLPYVTMKVKWHPFKSVNVTIKSAPREIALLKNERRVAFMNNDIHEMLQKELRFINGEVLKKHEKADLEMASQLNTQDYEETGQSIECGCCYGDYSFEDMVQCFEGHLFCANCLKSYTQEAVFGQGKSRLQCMSEDCEAGYPRSMMERVLTSQMIEKFEEREQFEALNLASIENLFQCPACQFAAIIEPQVRVFVCQNPACKKECCTKCKEDWKEHIGKKCEEIEKQDETKLRIEAEEKMTQAKIRLCGSCKKGMVKSDGCNKMTCTCGAKMCYICRLPHIDYNHFCQHVREPGHGCKLCTACSLWTNPDQDDERAIEEIRQKALQDARDKGFVSNAVIGAPGEPPAKKRKPNKPDYRHPVVL